MHNRPSFVPSVDRRDARDVWAAASVVGVLGLTGACALWLLSLAPAVPTQGSLAVASISARTEVLALGASHVFADVEPSLTGRPWVNLSAGLMNYAFMEAVLAAHEPQLRGLRAVVLDLDPLPVFTDSYASARGDFDHLLDLSPRLDVLAEAWPRRLALARERLLTRELPIRYAFSRRKLTTDNLLSALRGDPPEVENVAGHQRLPGRRPEATAWGARAAGHQAIYAPDAIDRNLAAFARIVRRIQARGVPLIFVRFPVHHAYLAAAPPEFETAFSRLRDVAVQLAPSAPFLDYARAPFTDDEFYDDDHLNQQGATRLTWMLAQRVEAVLAYREVSSTTPAP